MTDLTTSHFSELVSQHPLPWKCGEGHETMIIIMDANDKFVCKIDRTSWCCADMLGEFLIRSVEVYATTRETVAKGV